MALVCETVTASSMAELRRARDRATAADMVELRLDGVADPDVAGALAGRTCPVIVTCRPAWEGGAFDGSEGERLRLLAEAIAQGAEFVDVEWRADRSQLPLNQRTRIVLSHHDFNGVPADLANRVRDMRASAPAGVIKVAVLTKTFAECCGLRQAVGTESDQVVIGMGPAGSVTRACPWLFGSMWTYGGTAAPGQMSVADLVGMYRVGKTSRSTRIFALIGAPLAHSASPAMHNGAFAAAGLDAVYVPIETTAAADFLEGANAIGIEGASVTAPLKSGWPSLGVRVDAAAREIGAVNTLRRVGAGIWEATNFDVNAFLAPLIRRGHALAGQRAVVLGAGGAARGAAWTLKRHGAAVTVTARRLEAAQGLAADLGVEAIPWPPGPGWDVLVNATPVGTWPATDAAPLAPAAVGGRIVYDLVYNPPETALLRAARARGAEAIGGLEMLVAQAQAQFEYWTGMPTPNGVMERAASEFLQRVSEQ